jgi:hypothetical protein
MPFQHQAVKSLNQDWIGQKRDFVKIDKHRGMIPLNPMRQLIRVV